MLAYAANRPVAGKRESSPNALLAVISVHVALFAAVMSSKVDVSRIIRNDPPLIHIPVRPAPPPPGTTAHPRQQPQTHVTQVDRRTVIHKTTDRAADEPATDDHPIEIASGGGTGTPYIPPQPTTAPIRHEAQLLTSAADLKPPYPASKLAAEREATLQLALTIDGNGRVIAVEPVGYADQEFLASARRHIMSHWRYRPATEDGRAISSTLTVTLRFQLDG
jgi:protein TonB